MSKTYISAALRQQAQARAKGCCEYCLLPEVTAFALHEIDHVIAEKHGGLTVWVIWHCLVRCAISTKAAILPQY